MPDRRWPDPTVAMIVAVAVGGAIITAEGLYSVARMSGRPPFVAGWYPLITDGLAVTAYRLLGRLTGHTRLYAAAAVVLAAGLSAVAQGMALVHGPNVVPPVLVRFAIGAWPAVAVLLVAHLWWLAHRPTDHGPAVPERDEDQPDHVSTPAAVPAPATPDAAAPATDRSTTAQAASAATTWRTLHGNWPSKTLLAERTHVSPSTAQRALQRAKADYAESPQQQNGHATVTSR